MKIGTVIGRVTMGKIVPELEGGRWLLISPWTRGQFSDPTAASSRVSPDPSLVAYDALGAAAGQTIGYIEGREAAQPFPKPLPIDALCAALIDNVFYHPAS